jgi:hypothetical protein
VVRRALGTLISVDLAIVVTADALVNAGLKDHFNGLARKHREANVNGLVAYPSGKSIISEEHELEWRVLRQGPGLTLLSINATIG